MKAKGLSTLGKIDINKVPFVFIERKKMEGVPLEDVAAIAMALQLSLSPAEAAPPDEWTLAARFEMISQRPS
ncbi:MAG: hypothetical protein J5J00_04125 [Deltaproteobacteria bacterium]|nr:hypothetical protein [Deltaproteobacteria bacterium]